jgi:hypothetical protein
MKFVRFKSASDGSVKSAKLQEGKLHEIEGDIFGEWLLTGRIYDVNQVLRV